MNRPSFQFYPNDWLNDVNLRRCSSAARGAWMDILCVLHNSTQYGVWQWPLAELAQMVNAHIKLLLELREKNVLRGGDQGCEPLIYIPTHAGQEGPPATLIDQTTGRCWYSKRMVIDKHLRRVRGSKSRFDSYSNQPNRSRSVAPMAGIGERQGDGPSSSSSSSSSPSNISTTTYHQLSQEEQAERARQACDAMVVAGCDHTDPTNQKLLEALRDGVTDDELVKYVAAARAKKVHMPFGWAIKVASEMHSRQPRYAPRSSSPIRSPRTASGKAPATDRTPASAETAMRHLKSIGAVLHLLPESSIMKSIATEGNAESASIEAQTSVDSVRDNNHPNALPTNAMG